MSDDGTFIFRRDGEERFFYVRRGGSYIDRVMLRGEAGFLEHLDDTREWPYPFLETWLAGLLVVDFDAREFGAARKGEGVGRRVLREEKKKRQL